MRNSTLIRFLGISAVVASALGIASFFALRELNESSIGEIRRNAILFIAQTVESGPNYKEAIQSLHSRTERRFSGATFWIFSKQGEVLDSSREIRPPAEWSSLRKPLEKHDIVFQYGFLRLIPDLALVKLEKAEDNYLLIEFKRPGSMGRAIWMEIALFFFIGAVSVLVAVGMAYSYLRTKSKEAREILARLEKGDLKARFEIKRVDEIGSLMVDFNRMASEIERLVHRVQETEMARKDLLEELISNMVFGVLEYCCLSALRYGFILVAPL